MTRDSDTQGMVNIMSKFQVPSSNGLEVMMQQHPALPALPPSPCPPLPALARHPCALAPLQQHPRGQENKFQEGVGWRLDGDYQMIKMHKFSVVKLLEFNKIK